MISRIPPLKGGLPVIQMELIYLRNYSSSNFPKDRIEKNKSTAILFKYRHCRSLDVRLCDIKLCLMDRNA